jgi:pyruvate dehydrogenase E1 component beta subunit
LLKTAIRDDNPVVMVENKALYSRREEERPELAPIPLGQARVVRAGRDLTIVATSRLVGQALLAADELEKMDIMAEVIDPRTLVPLDIGTLVDSLSRTHRLIVAHEAVSHMGFGSEIAARLQEEAFDQLDAPIVRVGAPFTPVPVSPPLEDAYVPGSRQILAAAEQIYGRSFDGTRSPGLPEGR